MTSEPVARRTEFIELPTSQSCHWPETEYGVLAFEAIPGAILIWLVVSTHLKNISQVGNLPEIVVKIKNIRNHHLVIAYGELIPSTSWKDLFQHLGSKLDDLHCDNMQQIYFHQMKITQGCTPKCCSETSCKQTKKGDWNIIQTCWPFSRNSWSALWVLKTARKAQGIVATCVETANLASRGIQSKWILGTHPSVTLWSFTRIVQISNSVWLVLNSKKKTRPPKKPFDKKTA